MIKWGLFLWNLLHQPCGLFCPLLQYLCKHLHTRKYTLTMCTQKIESSDTTELGLFGRFHDGKRQYKRWRQQNSVCLCAYGSVYLCALEVLEIRLVDLEIIGVQQVLRNFNITWNKNILSNISCTIWMQPKYYYASLLGYHSQCSQ